MSVNHRNIAEKTKIFFFSPKIFSFYFKGLYAYCTVAVLVLYCTGLDLYITVLI